MPMNQSLIGKTYTQAESITVSTEAALAYAAATVGVGGQTLTAYVDGSVAPPMYGVAYSFGALGAPILDPELGVEMMRLVHGEQEMRFVKAVRPGDVITSKSSVFAIEPKTSGELLVVAITSQNQRGEIVLEAKSALFIRGPRKKEHLEGEQAEKAREEAEWQALPRLFEEVVVVAADQSKRYAAASGDHNPIHLDDDVAKMAGLPSIILHGLCTMAFVHDALVRRFGPDPLCVRRLAVRFNRPVLMGDRLTIEARGSAQRLAFQMRNQDGVVVLKAGQAEIA